MAKQVYGDVPLQIILSTSTKCTWQQSVIKNVPTSWNSQPQRGLIEEISDDGDDLYLP